MDLCPVAVLAGPANPFAKLNMETTGQQFVQEYHGVTTLHPLGLVMALGCGLALVAVPRRYAIWPMIVMACNVAPAQRIVILCLDFNMLRVMVLWAWLRILGHEEWRAFRWQPLDSLLIAWAVVQTVNYTLLMGSSAAFVNRLGVSFDAVGMYFAFRCLLRNWDDYHTTVLGLAIVALPVMAAFIVEEMTSRNLFAFFGGVPEITREREGRLRCQGAFAHPILAGCFWAVVLPLIAARWWTHPAGRTLTVLSVLACLVIVVCCASSTPVGGVVAGLVGAAFFGLRRHMRTVRWATVLTLVGLHLVMNAPVWHLISRISAVGGSTGWHRYNIINQAINRVGEWWLLGTRNITHWHIWANDITNQYVAEAITGGIWKLGLLIAIIVLAFRATGQLLRMVEHDRPLLITTWAIGVSLFVHCTNFIGITYTGQIILVWYLSLAMAGSLRMSSQVQGRTVCPPRGVCPRHPLAIAGAGDRLGRSAPIHPSPR